MMITNLFVIANVKQLRTDGSFRILLPFFRTSWSVGVLNSAIFNSFHSRVEFGTVLEGLRNFGEVGFNTPNPSHRYAIVPNIQVYLLYELRQGIMNNSLLRIQRREKCFIKDVN